MKKKEGKKTLAIINQKYRSHLLDKRHIKRYTVIDKCLSIEDKRLSGRTTRGEVGKRSGFYAKGFGLERLG